MSEGLSRWLKNEGGASVLAFGLLLIAVWLLGWAVGHATGGVIQVFEQAAFGMHGVAAAAVVGVAGTGRHIVGEPVSTKVADSVSPGLLRNEIDERIVKIRPMSTPLDQISRYGGSRHCGSMKVEYYSVDTKPSSAKVKTAVAACTERTPGEYTATVNTDNNDIFQPSTTIIVPTVKATKGDALVLYVVGITDGGVKVLPVNNTISAGVTGVPAIPAGTEFVRMGRAATEMDVCTPQFGSLPTKSDNLCQIFKAQVEQSTFMKIANKEVGWTFSDQEEAAIIDMRMGMEKNFLFGCKARITDPEKGEEVLLTGGVWNQTDNEFAYDASAALTDETLVKLCRQAFSHNAGSSKKGASGRFGAYRETALARVAACAGERGHGDQVGTRLHRDTFEIRHPLCDACRGVRPLRPQRLRHGYRSGIHHQILPCAVPYRAPKPAHQRRAQHRGRDHNRMFLRDSALSAEPHANRGRVTL